jgi:hypothetical protein
LMILMKIKTSCVFFFVLDIHYRLEN